MTVTTLTPQGEALLKALVHHGGSDDFSDWLPEAELRHRLEAIETAARVPADALLEALHEDADLHRTGAVGAATQRAHDLASIALGHCPTCERNRRSAWSLITGV